VVQGGGHKLKGDAKRRGGRVEWIQKVVAVQESREALGVFLGEGRPNLRKKD